MTDDPAEPNQSADDVSRGDSDGCDSAEPSEDTATQSEDFPERFRLVARGLSKLRFSALGRRLPMPVITPVMYLEHLIAIYNSHRWAVAGKPPFSSELDAFAVPQDEHVSIPALFIVELFPPSEIARFRRSLDKNKITASQLRYYPDMAMQLDKARAGSKSSWSWLRLGTIVRRNSGIIVTEPVIGKPPKEFSSVELKELHIGDGITALMAWFDLSESSARRVDGKWHKEYRPIIDWGKPRQWPQSVGPMWAAFREVQEARASIHNSARRWFADAFPGVFASNNEPQPLIDVLVFDKLEAALTQSPSNQTHDRLRALGLPGTHAIYRSPQFPEMVLAPVSSGVDSDLDETRAWALWGQRNAILNALAGYLNSLNLPRNDRGISYYIQHAIEDYFLRLAIVELLVLCQKRYASVRDTARQRHGKFRNKHLKELRSTLLTLSLDLTSMERDLRKYHSRGWRYDDAKFYFQESPWAVKNAAEHGFASSEPINTNMEMFHDQEKILETLASADRDYRGVLTAAAQLTSSMQALRTSRVALAVALISAAFGSVGVLLTEAVNHTHLDAILHWISSP